MEKYVYLVEGENEKRLVDYLKVKPDMIISGSTIVHNVLEKKINNGLLASINKNTTVVLIFDTDIDNLKYDIFKANLKQLKKKSKNVYVIPQIKNFEDEIVYSTNIKKIVDLFKSTSVNHFKKDFNDASDSLLDRKFKETKFDINKLWSRDYTSGKEELINESNKIKLNK